MLNTDTRFRFQARRFFWAYMLGIAVLVLPLATQAQQTKITASDGTGADNPVDSNGDRFGSSVALSGDGDRALVGSWTDNINGNADVGSAYVLTREASSTWTEEAKLTSSDSAEFDRFSSDPSTGVALDQDGDMALVGAVTDGDGGSAYVFTRDDTDNWSLQRELTVSESDLFGVSVSISADGQRALVGATGSNEGAGAVYVFTRSEGVGWLRETTLFPDSAGGVEEFGRVVSLSPDGGRALVGSPTTNVDENSNQGAGYVFVRNSPGEWEQEAKLTLSEGAPDQLLGTGVSISGDESTSQRALLGAPLVDVEGNADQGRAYVFVRNGNNWSQEEQFTGAAGATFPNLGESVAISNDATRAIVSAHKDDLSGDDTNEGSVYVFNRAGSDWSQGPVVAADDADPSDEFGKAVTISGNGERVFVGTRFDDIEGRMNQGSTYALGPSSLPVELADFMAQRDEEVAILSWRTLSETNNARFDVQHRAPNSSSYVTIGSVDGAGTTTASQTYRFRTGTLSPGTHRFQLRQVDTDGTTTLAGPPQVVKVQAEQSLSLKTTGPHPVRSRTTLHFTVKQDGPAIVILYDMLGQRVKLLRRGTAQTGRQYTVSLNTEGLASGMYFVRLRGSSGTRTRRVAVIR